MSSLGFYRYKFIPTLPGVYKIDFNINAVVAATHYVTVNDFCDQEIYLKFLDKNGQFRFQKFNRFNEIRLDSSLIGKTDKLITNLLTSQSNSNVIGYESKKLMALVAEGLDSEQREILSQIFESNQIFIKVGSNDSKTDWLQVVAVDGDKNIKLRKNNFSDFNLTVELPKSYNITL